MLPQYYTVVLASAHLKKSIPKYFLYLFPYDIEEGNSAHQIYASIQSKYITNYSPKHILPPPPPIPINYPQILTLANTLGAIYKSQLIYKSPCFRDMEGN